MKRRSQREVPAADRRLEFSMHVRGDENPFAAISKVETEGTVFLGPDEWNFKTKTTISKTVGVLSHAGKMIASASFTTNNDDGFINITADNVVLNGLRITGQGSVGRGIFINANNVKILNCVIEGFNVGIEVNESAFVKIEGNTFVNNADVGILVNRANACQITNNMIVGTPATKGIFMDTNTTKSLILANVLPDAALAYTHTGKANQPNNATNAGFTNVANSITVS